jgi:hypothetical protein
MTRLRPNIAIAVLFVAAGVLGGCNRIRATLEMRSADQFAQQAFEKLRTHELRQLPLSSQYDEPKIRSTEAASRLLPVGQPQSSRRTEVQTLGDRALVRRQYVYSDKTLVVSVGMERSGALAPWKLSALSVTPSANAG